MRSARDFDAVPRLRAHQRRPPVEARPQPDETHQLSRPDAPALVALVERDGNRRRRRVPVLLDFVVHALVRQPSCLLHCLADAQVGLVRDEQ